MIAQGAHPKAIQAQLGHSSIQVTLDLYGHLFPDDMDRLATQLNAAHEAVSGPIAASVRPGGGAEVELARRVAKIASDQRFRSWGGVDSNHRPTDYESALWEGAVSEAVLATRETGVPPQAVSGGRNVLAGTDHGKPQFNLGRPAGPAPVA